jgi:hypothetical protein
MKHSCSLVEPKQDQVNLRLITDQVSGFLETHERERRDFLGRLDEI